MQSSQVGERRPGGNAAERHSLAGTAQGLPQPAATESPSLWHPESPSSTRRAPACGAPPAAEATLVACGGKGSLPPVPAAPSKKQGAVSCPLGRPAKGNPVGNWISQPRVSRTLGAALFLLNGSCVGLREISAPIHSQLQDVMDSVLIQALVCG